MNRFKRSLIWKSLSRLLPNKQISNKSNELKTIKDWRSICNANQIIDNAIECQKRAALILNNIFEGRRRICGFDLDDTLIKTKSGRKFRKDSADWTWNGEVIEKIQYYYNHSLCLL